MRIKIYFPPYREAEITEITAEGFLCDLSGDEIQDIDIFFPIDNPVIRLTDKQIVKFKEK